MAIATELCTFCALSKRSLRGLPNEALVASRIDEFSLRRGSLLCSTDESAGGYGSEGYPASHRRGNYRMARLRLPILYARFRM